jgi:hypothetical protein
LSPEPGKGEHRAITLAWAAGTYLNTTTAISRQERVAATGLDVRAKANMVVDDGAVRWEREDLGEVRIAGPRLLGASLKRDLAAQLRGQAHIVLVSWRADKDTHGNEGDRYVTSFLPRTRADSAVLVSAVQRLMRIGAASDHANLTDDGPTTPDGTP